ncbi:MAG: hypothetical protein IPI91_17460 [Flavobacteriales bacterium]|nr:hypothetical protein [Flavobacteriales bacterium]
MAKKPNTFNTGIAINVPRSNGLRCKATSMRRAISMPVTSSPCNAAMIRIVGPSSFAR